MVTLEAAFALAASAATPGLAACTGHGTHDRWDVKTRSAPSGRPQRVTVAEVLAWPVTFYPARVWNVAGWRAAGENRYVTITARIRRVKLAADDCDVHLELAADGSASAPRIIAEIPQRFASVQRALAVGLGRHIGSGPIDYSGYAAPTVTLTGLAFLDVWHQSQGTTQGHAHGSRRVLTIWEVCHPCVSVEVR